VRARASGTQVNFAYLLTTVDGVLGRFELDLQPTTDNFYKVRVAQQARAYADAGTEARVCVDVAGSLGSGVDVEAAIFGCLMDIP